MASKADDAFDVGDYVVYPKHGVGRVIELQSEEIAGMQLDLYVLRGQHGEGALMVHFLDVGTRVGHGGGDARQHAGHIACADLDAREAP